MYKHSAGAPGCDFLQCCCFRPLLSRHHAVFYSCHRCRPKVSDADDTHRVVRYCSSHLHWSGQILQSIYNFKRNEKWSLHDWVNRVIIHYRLDLGRIERRSKAVFEWLDEFRIARCSYERLCNRGWNSDSCIHRVWGKFILWRNTSLVYFRNYSGMLTFFYQFFLNKQ